VPVLAVAMHRTSRRNGWPRARSPTGAPAACRCAARWSTDDMDDAAAGGGHQAPTSARIAPAVSAALRVRGLDEDGDLACVLFSCMSWWAPRPGRSPRTPQHRLISPSR
jgi:hypothetical protein